MNLKNKTAQKIISLLLIVSILSPAGFVLFSQPKEAKAIYGVADLTIDIPHIATQVGKFLKDTLKEIGKEFLRSIGRKLIDKVSKSTVEWINKGFKGKPLFLEQPGVFVKDIIKEEVKVLIKDIGYDKNKFPYGKDFALALIDQAKAKFQENATYSTAKLGNSIYNVANMTQQELDLQSTNQRKNFSVGGFEQFLMDSQLQQNNFIGFAIKTSQEMSRRSSGTLSPVQKAKDVLAQGAGFLSPKECQSNPNWDPDKLKEGPPPSRPFQAPVPLAGQEESPKYLKQLEEAETAYGNKEAQDFIDWKKKYGCKEELTNTTPGGVISNRIMQALNIKDDQLGLATAMGNVLSALFDSLFNKLAQVGLNKLAEKFVEPPEQTIDDFNYFGENESTGTQYYGSPPTSFTKLTVMLNVVNSTDGSILSNSLGSVFIDGNLVASGSSNTVTPGTHMVTATGPGNYTVTIVGDCLSDGSVTLAQDESKICNVTVSTDTPLANTQNFAKLTVVKEVINDNGGTLDPNSVALFVDNNPVNSGVQGSYETGQHTVSETNPPGYTATFSGDCNSNGSVNLNIGDIKTCTITNDDGAATAKLTVNKVIINDSGGAITTNSVPLFIDGVSTTSGVEKTVNTGTRVVSETNPPGYTATFSGDCNSSGSVTLAADEVKSCTITNDDIVGYGIAKLTVTNIVINDDGGTLLASRVPLFVDGKTILSGVEYDYVNGPHTITETGQYGYSVTFGGDCNTDGTITLVKDTVRTCTITNDDIIPKLTVVKYVINDDGGTLDPSSVALYVNGKPVLNGQQYEYPVGTYNVAENNPFGYTATFQGYCDSNGSITLAVGDVKTCVIVNNDIGGGSGFQQIQ